MTTAAPALCDGYPRLLHAGDTAVVVELGSGVDAALNLQVMRLNAVIRDARLTGVSECVPSFRSVMVHYDPLATTYARLEAALGEIIAGDWAEHRFRGHLWDIPACYEADLAPDLDSVAEQTGIAPDEVVRRHCAETYFAYMIGAFPGFPYLGDLPAELALPRRQNPRLKVPAGSVAITGRLTAVYPLETPGGWNLIGRTPVGLFDPAAPRPALMEPGDRVRFQPIERAAYDDLAASVAAGTFRLESEEQSL